MSLLTFVIPVRHQDNATDWGRLKANLAQTIASLCAQGGDDWRAVIVANEGADLPDLPKQFSAVRVTFPPNDLHALGSGPPEAFLDAFRFDKGRRVMAGMLAARDSEYFMIVDDDDFVSARLMEHVRAHRGANGWVVNRGWIWSDGGDWVLQHDDFNHICGTCLVVRSDLYDLPESFEQADRTFMMNFMGSHYSVAKLFGDKGAPLAQMPFRAAMYRVGHPGSHSQTPGLFSKYVFTRAKLRRPWRALLELARVRRVSGKIRGEFFGVDHV